MRYGRILVDDFVETPLPNHVAMRVDPINKGLYYKLDTGEELRAGATGEGGGDGVEELATYIRRTDSPIAPSQTGVVSMRFGTDDMLYITNYEGDVITFAPFTDNEVGTYIRNLNFNYTPDNANVSSIRFGSDNKIHVMRSNGVVTTFAPEGEGGNGGNGGAAGAAGSTTYIQYNNNGNFAASEFFRYIDAPNFNFRLGKENPASTKTLYGSLVKDWVYIYDEQYIEQFATPRYWANNNVGGNNHFIWGEGMVTPNNSDTLFMFGGRNQAAENAWQSFVFGGENITGGVGSPGLNNHTLGVANQNLGYSHCTVIGYANTTAAGENQQYAIGDQNTITEQGGYALGNNNIVSGNYSFVIGIQSQANGDYSYALGNNVIADGDNAIAMGNNSRAIGTGSLAAGRYVVASGEGAVATGLKEFYQNGDLVPDTRNVLAAGRVSFNHSYNDVSQTDNHGALANYSAILGGWNANIPAANVGSVLTASNQSKMPAGYSYTHAAPRFMSLTNGAGLIVHSPNGTRFLIGATDAGALSITPA